MKILLNFALENSVSTFKMTTGKLEQSREQGPDFHPPIPSPQTIVSQLQLN